MKHEQRKTAVAAYRERKTAAGIYAVVCLGSASGGSAGRRTSIASRTGCGSPGGMATARTRPCLQAAWTAHGAETFAMEIIERLDEETLSYVRDRVLKDRLAHWCSAFGAEA